MQEKGETFMATVEDIMELPFFKENELKLLAGKKGLNRIVTRPNIAQLMNFSDWMGGGEFLLINGVGLHLDQKENLLTVIENAQKGKAACIVFEISQTYLPTIPQEAIDLSNDYQLPIFTLSWDVSFGQILNTVYDYIVRKEREDSNVMDLMRNILFTDFNPGSILQQADYYGYNLRNPHQCIIACIEDLSFEKDFYDAIKKVMENQKKLLAMEQNASLILFYPTEQKKEMKALFQLLLSNYKNAYIAVGNSYSDVLKYRESYNQAVQALRFLSVTKDKQIMFYDELGLLKLLNDDENGKMIKEYIHDFLLPLKSYQKKYSVDLIESLNVYQECNFNIAQASQKLFIHRNTLLQRLDKIANLLEIDFNDFNVRREIMDVMYLRKYYG